MTPPATIAELVARFDDNREAYRSGQYNEAQVRQEFLNPFFEALGWDVYNRRGYAEAYKEVIHEAAIKIGGRTKAPDYCFRVGGGRPSFFVEAKKPSVDIREAVSPAYQLRRYAWSAKLPVSILTDFEEFAVYDCRIRPVKNDKAATARVIFRQFTEYPDCWDELAGLFSPEAIRRGSLDRFLASKKVKKGTAEVDAAFLDEIESWRNDLARNIALRNKDLSQRDLNFAVQRTIDRLIFLRICEDRGIEPYGRLQGLLNGSTVYRRLAELFHRADERYNSGLFHFTAERDRDDPPDELTLGLSVDDKPLKEIIRKLYYPESPYEFSVLPAEILGQVYEQFLGKVIRLTKSHQAKVEEKPEVKKAGGVYYTPAYIVDYIVEHTVGRLLSEEGDGGGKKGEGVVVGRSGTPSHEASGTPSHEASGTPSHEPRNTPSVEGKGEDEETRWITPRRAAKLKILDPACGSGSFLIGAYQYLLDWYRDRYVEDDPERHAKGRKAKLYRHPAGDWRLTTAERKRILLNHIYGVDIDPQAVEVTKLSLLLKVLEGESQETLNTQLRLFHERALPDLAANIKCGNSLIGPDFYADKQMSLLDEEEIYRINAFDWEAEFPEVFKGKNPGFDAVVGNPPYVFGRDWKALHISDEVKHYLGSHYTASPYQLDMFSIFMERAASVCTKSGYVGQIVPNVWLSNTYSSTTRAFILEQAADLCIVSPPPNVFRGLTVDTVVYTYRKEDSPTAAFEVWAMSDQGVGLVARHNVQVYRDGDRPISTVLTSGSADLVYKLKDAHPELREFADFTRGVHPYRTGGYGESAFTEGPQTKRDVDERPYNSAKQKPGYRPFIYGRDLKRFKAPEENDYIKYGRWLAEPRRGEFFEGPRVYSRKILGERLVVTIERGDSVADQQVYITKPRSGGPSAACLCAILGSRLMSFFIRAYYDEVNDAFPQIKVGQLKRLPIPRATSGNMTQVERRLAEYIDEILHLNGTRVRANTSHEKSVLGRQISAVDRQIDQLVYELYGLTDEEIRIVEEATSG